MNTCLQRVNREQVTPKISWAAESRDVIITGLVVAALFFIVALAFHNFSIRDMHTVCILTAIGTGFFIGSFNCLFIKLVKEKSKKSQSTIAEPPLLDVGDPAKQALPEGGDAPILVAAESSEQPRNKRHTFDEVGRRTMEHVRMAEEEQVGYDDEIASLHLEIEAEPLFPRQGRGQKVERLWAVRDVIIAEQQKAKVRAVKQAIEDIEAALTAFDCSRDSYATLTAGLEAAKIVDNAMNIESCALSIVFFAKLLTKGTAISLSKQSISDAEEAILECRELLSDSTMELKEAVIEMVEEFSTFHAAADKHHSDGGEEEVVEAIGSLSKAAKKLGEIAKGTSERCMKDLKLLMKQSCSEAFEERGALGMPEQAVF